ncbi:hypothetical protein MA16_Dca009476 [Dendrobium catenatum]|uniref:Uncharacterized protein n=1 Tax=Dendrobium catenatum TaxID=906689 RepID=A0A2I0X502_9ASPA|nr:hypothetical protein MA16_Dca009476 [Dendrobium catenatum]
MNSSCDARILILGSFKSLSFHTSVKGSLLGVRKNIREVTKDHDVLNYDIQVGYTLDVGKIIHSSSTYIIRDATSMGLGYPSLIYALYVNAGMRGGPSEEEKFLF